jgi:hypothetical protein
MTRRTALLHGIPHMPLPRNFAACSVPTLRGATFCQNTQKDKVEQVLIKINALEGLWRKLVSPHGVRKASWVIKRETIQ